MIGEYLVERCDPESGTIPKCHCCYNHEDISESGIITGKLEKKSGKSEPINAVTDFFIQAIKF